jgi:DNA-binding winged helix-turn-helix (wHTH) protein
VDRKCERTCHDGIKRPPRRIVRFAAFEFDPGSGELRKHGLRIKLNGQPIDLLAMLIEHAGEVVTREELQKRLRPAETYVDFEHSLNAAIKRLRAALGDSADAPRFIETLARQGYRFIAPLSPSRGEPTGAVTIFFWGWTTYDDIFSKHHITMFCTQMIDVAGGDPTDGRNTFQMFYQSCQIHNCADEECEGQAYDNGQTWHSPK